MVQYGLPCRMITIAWSTTSDTLLITANKASDQVCQLLKAAFTRILGEIKSVSQSVSSKDLANPCQKSLGQQLIFDLNNFLKKLVSRNGP